MSDPADATDEQPVDLPRVATVICGFPAGGQVTCELRVTLPARYRRLADGRGGIRRYRRLLVGHCPAGHAVAISGVVKGRSGPGAPPPFWMRPGRPD